MQAFSEAFVHFGWLPPGAIPTTPQIASIAAREGSGKRAVLQAGARPPVVALPAQGEECGAHERAEA